MEQGFDFDGALRPRRVALYAGGTSLLALGANFLGATSALLSLAPAPSRLARLDLIYPVAGFKRCVDPEGGRFSFTYPARLLADQRRYQQRALTTRSNVNDPLLERSGLDAERRGRRAAGLPLPLTPSLSVVAFGNGAPRGFSLGAEENLAIVVGALPAGATLRSAFGEPADAAKKLLRLTRGGTAALVDARAVRSASGAVLYLIEYTVDAPGAPEQAHVLCALAAGGAQQQQQLFTLTYRSPASRWITSEADVRQTIASFDVSV